MYTHTHTSTVPRLPTYLPTESMYPLGQSSPFGSPPIRNNERGKTMRLPPSVSHLYQLQSALRACLPTCLSLACTEARHTRASNYPRYPTALISIPHRTRHPHASLLVPTIPHLFLSLLLVCVAAAPHALNQPRINIPFFDSAPNHPLESNKTNVIFTCQASVDVFSIFPFFSHASNLHSRHHATSRLRMFLHHVFVRPSFAKSIIHR
ncbi:unnamed protein product [Periconia digitata]|uniref:Uncharacterized protein n=1 Tax=Periconia digitata TaxID=1303443 RepID=A0A9W4UPP7_9PLEO|nr:unnamed protein product [Periconia digitata]